MGKRFQLRKNDWVKVMMPHTKRQHCLAIIDAEFAHAYCGKSFRVGDLIGIAAHDPSQRCRSCADHSILDSHTIASPEVAGQ